MSLAVETAPNSWGVWFSEDDRQPPWHRFLNVAAGPGYRCIELGAYGYRPTDPERSKSEVGRRGLGLLAGTLIADPHIPEERTDLHRKMADLAPLVAALGGRFIVPIPDL